MMNIRRIVRWLPVLGLMVLAAPTLAVEPSVQGIPNFHQVNTRMYRGGQPSIVAWPQLAALGVKTVIDLRRDTEHSKPDEARAVEAAGMRYVSFPMNGFATPTEEQIAAVHGLIEAGETVFVHCKLGMDRTGVVVAAYRIARENWANQQALDEANSLGLHWYERGKKRFILDYRMPDPPSSTVTSASATTTTSMVGPGGR